MEGDDREDRKRAHSPHSDYRRPKTSRPDRDDPRRDDRDRNRDRADRGSGHVGESPFGHRRSDNGTSRDGYQSYGRGNHHNQNQPVRIARSRPEATSTGEAHARVADEFTGNEGRRENSRDRHGTPGEDHRSSESRRGSFPRDRPGRSADDSRSSFVGPPRSPSASEGRAPPERPDFRHQPSPNGSSGSRDGGFSRARPSPASDSSESRERSLSFSRRNPDEATKNVPDFHRPNRNRSLDGRGECVSEERPRSDGSSGSQERDFSEDQPGYSGSMENRGRGFARSGFSGQRPVGTKPDGPALQERLQNVAAADKSSVDVNDPSQDVRGGRRGMRPPRPSDAQLADFVRTRPEKITDKTAKPVRGVEFHTVRLISNYYRMDNRDAWKLCHYHVDFIPEIERTQEKRALFRPHAQKLPGWHIFDGSALYSALPLPENILELHSARMGSEEKVLIKISREPKIVDEYDPVNIQIYNILIRNCMRHLNLKQIGRHYYDPEQKHIFGEVRLEVWPGYKTSIRQHESGLLLCVEMTNKVIRKETAWDVICGHGERGREEATNELLGCIVMTPYNGRTYRIDDINWEETPLTEFSYQGNQTSYADYLRSKYGTRVRSDRQPMLYSKAKRKDIRRGMVQNIALVPELCLMTGLKDEHRRNFQVMKKLNVKLQLDPTARIANVKRFSDLLTQKQVRQKVLEPAGLHLGTDLVKIKGHIFRPQTIQFGNGKISELKEHSYDWGRDVVMNPMVSTIPLKKWAVVATQSDANYSTFIRLVISSAHAMGFRIEEAGCIKLAAQRNPRSYISTIDEIMTQEKDKIQMIVCILPTPDENLYGEIKRKCYLDYGIASQCVLMKNVAPSGNNKQRGIAAKIAIQMTAKLGGVPWSIALPVKKAMTVGFNISTMGRTRGSNTRQSVGALVATINPEHTKFFSCIVNQDQGQLLSTLLGSKLVQALHAYSHANDQLPSQILFYRDGMGEGQLQSVVDTEVEEIKTHFMELYSAKGMPAPAFLFIVVNKRLSTKFFVPQNAQLTDFSNPLPGTVVDDVVTLPERYDFYLISTKGTGQGTLSPTSYNIIHDNSNWEPGQVQLLTHKLCHLYFNWTSTVSVPSVCQYAHKLAFLQNLMNKTGRRGEGSSEPKPQLANTLFYL